MSDEVTEEEVIPLEVKVVNQPVEKKEEFDDAPEYHTETLTKEEMEDEELEY